MGSIGGRDPLERMIHLRSSTLWEKWIGRDPLVWDPLEGGIHLRSSMWNKWVRMDPLELDPFREGATGENDSLQIKTKCGRKG